MPVTDEEMVLLYAFLSGEHEVADRARTQIAAAGTTGITQLVHAALVIAARRAFPPPWTRADIIRLVAQIRARLAERPDLLDPLAAEHELRSALGDSPAGYQPSPQARAHARLILLSALVQTGGLDDQGRADLLNQARELADQMMTTGS